MPSPVTPFHSSQSRVANLHLFFNADLTFLPAIMPMALAMTPETSCIAYANN